MKATNIAFTGIPVTDMKRARDFYEGVLGLKPSEDFSEGVWIEYEIGPGTIANVTADQERQHSTNPACELCEARRHEDGRGRLIRRLRCTEVGVSAECERDVRVEPVRRRRRHGAVLGPPVAPLRRERRDLFSKARHPFFTHADAAFFLARRAGRPVGRIEAIVNHSYGAVHDAHTGFFGAFECENDRATSAALLDAAAAWLRARGMTAMRGPFTHSQNEEYGLLVDGFHLAPRGMGAISTPVTEKDVDELSDAVVARLAALQREPVATA